MKKKTMLRLMAALLTGTMLFALTACGNNRTDKPATPDKPINSDISDPENPSAGKAEKKL